MEIRAWFGRVDTDAGSFVPAKGEGEKEAEKGITDASHHHRACGFEVEMQPDLRALANACGFALDDQDYNARLREEALKRVHRQLKSGRRQSRTFRQLKHWTT
jgi:hypothetical protein